MGNIPPSAVSMECLDVLFHNARTLRVWQDRPVERELLARIYESMKFGPTSSNTNPFRCLFVISPEAKDRLIPLMNEGNRKQTRTAPVVALFARDERFFERMEVLMPGKKLGEFFAGNPDVSSKTADQGSTLQAAYFMIAARGYGLDCGPMAGFDSEGINREFFADSSWRIQFVCNLGYGEHSSVQPRMPRLRFEEACEIV